MKYLISVIPLLLLACSPGGSSTKGAADNTLESLQANIDAVFQVKIKDNSPGAAVLVVYDDEVLVQKGYGLRSLENQLPITPTTNMRMGSVSKQFTALAVLSLVDQGKLALEDTLFNYYPYEIFRQVTIEQLINHTSGIADAEAYFLENWRGNTIAENKDLVQWYATNPSSYFAPAKRFLYNNGAYELLASLVEKVSGMEFSAFAKKHVFEKAGMKNTNFFNLAQPIEIPEKASCYEMNEQQQWQNVDGHPLNGLLGAGGVYTNLVDFVAYDKALREQRILSKKLHERIFTPSSMDLPVDTSSFEGFLGGETENYAMGWSVSDDYAHHGGSWFGTSTFVLKDRKKPLTMVVFMNSDALFSLGVFEKTFALVHEYLENNTQPVQAP